MGGQGKVGAFWGTGLRDSPRLTTLREEDPKTSTKDEEDAPVTFL